MRGKGRRHGGVAAGEEEGKAAAPGAPPRRPRGGRRRARRPRARAARPPEGLLARLWELPHTEAPAGSEPAPDPAGGPAASAAREALAAPLAADGLGLGPAAWLMHAEHTFSHIHWDMEVYVCRPEASPLGSAAEPPLPSHYRWVNREEMAQLAFPNVFLRILNAYFTG
ncbi:NUDIX domain-containing protein [Paenibacillus sp. P26]|nr:NUDIX domain-containing protein [Paenibacillus sp. P26]